MTVRIWLALVLALLSVGIGFAQEPNVIKEIEVRGAVNVNKDTILAAMRTKIGQPYVQAQLDQDKKAIEDLGFFQAVDVRAREIGSGNWQVAVEVVEFPKIREYRIVGNTAVKTGDIEKVVAADGLPLGNIFNLKSQGAVSRAIEKLYTDRGYFGQVEDLGPTPGSPETLTVSILELRVGTVSVQGATRTKKYVLDRLIKTRPGDPLHIPSWRDDLRRLYSTQWFEKVESIQNPTDDPGKVDLIADVTEARTGIINVGVQIDPRNSIAGLLRLTDTNWRGTGQSVGIGVLQGSAGGGTSVDLDYGNPFIDRHDTALNVSLYSRVLYRFTGVGFGGNSTPTDDSQYTERRTGVNMSLSRPFRKQYLASVGLRFEDIKTNDLDTNVDTGFIQQDGQVGTLTFGLGRDRRDVVVDPSSGDYTRILVEPGYSRITHVGGDFPDNSIIGSHTFLRSTFEYRTYFSPGQPPRGLKVDESRRVIAVRLRYGQISGKVPFFEQFFVGGSDSLRGYQEDRFWGRNMALASFEYRHPIQKSFNAILFADYGSAWGGYGTVNNYSQSDKPDFKLGYGLGLSFRTPLGPIRLDFGFNDKGKSRTHFVIGTSF